MSKPFTPVGCKPTFAYDKTRPLSWGFGETKEEFAVRLAEFEATEAERRAQPVTVGAIEDAVRALDDRLAAIQKLLDEALRSSWSVQRVR